MKTIQFLIALIACGAVTCFAKSNQSIDRSTWVATDALGRIIEESDKAPVDDRTVGIFYFIWHGAHGYDGGRVASDESVLTPLPTDVNSPYDITKMVAKNPLDPQYGPLSAFHYWSEPRFGYYVPDDEWVIRKHAQMLCDAGVDLIILDATNAFTYLSQVTTICKTYSQMRSEGSSTPQIAFIVNSIPDRTVARLYENFYAKGLYKELWFVWKGKPLLLTPPEGVTPQIADFFTVRHSWFSSTIGDWFGDGRDKWCWADLYPQTAGWHESPSVAEQISVAAATHPMSNIGRSYRNGKQPAPDEVESGVGHFFKEQTDYALKIDPQFVFVTGWNEWVAQRFNDGRSQYMMGRKIETGDTYFVDQYNAEFSRDLEPVRGDFEDNYYYQLAGFVRKYKGGEKIEPISASGKISIDGRFDDWNQVMQTYTDDAGDTFHRDHHGWGQEYYINNSGRNDIVKAKIAVHGKMINFMVETAQPITSYKDSDWMQLFISTDGSGWEGYRYALNIDLPTAKTATLSESKQGWNWVKKAKVSYSLVGNRMEVAIPLTAIEISADQPFTIDFKWVDNGATDGDILMWQDHGDAAPNARFRYRYKYTPFM